MVSIVFCFESQHVGEGPTEVGVLLQDRVPFVGVDASCDVSRIKSCFFFSFSCSSKTQGLVSIFCQCSHG